MSDRPEQAEVLLLTAQDDPLPGVANPAASQRYRSPVLRMQKRPLAALPAGYVRMRMKYVGICGTDVHLLETHPETGYVLTSAPAVIPPQGRIIGHEGVGQVVSLGHGVTHIRPGDYAGIASVGHCMYCSACRRGAFNQCHNASLLGMEQDGIFGTVVDVPAALVHDITAAVTGEESLLDFACLEPAATAMLACENARVGPGDKVAVFGAGPIGLYVAMICKRVMGAVQVTVIEPQERRRSLAAAWCDRAVAVEDYPGDSAAGVDVVIEASGDIGNVSRIFPRINANGRVTLLARSGMPLVLDSVDHMITQAISISGCRGHLGGPIQQVIALCRSGVLPLNAAVTRVVESLDGLLAALSDTGAIVRDNCKILARLS